MDGRFRWLEAVCLVGVLLATSWVELKLDQPEQENDPVVAIDGYVVLSSRSSMDSLNLDSFQVGARATFNLEVEAIESIGCADCQYPLEGRRISGNVNITELFDEQGRSGRIEATLVIEHLEERDQSGFLIQEWFHLDWDAGVSSFDQMVHVLHSSTPWDSGEEFGSFLVQTGSGMSSRTGPNLITEQVGEGKEVVRACLPDSFTCNAISNWDIEMSVFREPLGDSIEVDVPAQAATYVIPEESGSADPGFFGSWLPLIDGDERLSSSCLQDPGSIQAAGTWVLEESSTGVLSPLSSVLASAGMPVLQIQIEPGNLIVIEGSLGTCSTFFGSESESKISIFEN